MYQLKMRNIHNGAIELNQVENVIKNDKHTHIKLCSDLSLQNYCVNYVLNKFLHLSHIFIIATIKELLILNVNFSISIFLIVNSYV